MTDTLKIESDGFNITTVTHVETGLRFKSLGDYDAFMAKTMGEPIVLVDDEVHFPRAFTAAGRHVAPVTALAGVNGVAAKSLSLSRLQAGKRYVIEDTGCVEVDHSRPTSATGWLCVRDHLGPKYQPMPIHNPFKGAAQMEAFQAIVNEAHSMAVSKGWHDVAWAALPTKAARADRLGSLLALVHSEVSEALEAYRARELEAWTREDGKPEGVSAELADVVIRVADLAGYLGIDLGAAIRGKMDFNATRPHRHGGKAL